MSLNNALEKPIYGLKTSIVVAGSFESDGSYPYVYNNQNSGIVMQDLDKDFKPTNNNIIQKTKSITYNYKTYTIPLIKNQVNYELMPAILSKSNIKSSYIVTFPIYKTISSGYDKNGMLLYGFRYDQDSDKTYKFKTVGIRIVNDINDNGTYGYTVRLEALQYDQDDDSNTTISSIKKVYEHFYPFYYSLSMITLLIRTEVKKDSDNDDALFIYVDSLDKDYDGNRLISFSGSFKLSDINLSKDNIYQCVTMPELNQSIEYSLFNIKVYSDNLSLNVLEQQSYILVTK